MTLFDRYVVVDWSAASSPVTGADSIWIAVLDGDGDVALTNPPTRRGAEAEIATLLGGDSRTLLTVDACLGYPVGTAGHFALSVAGEPPWRSMWRAISERLVDDDANRNDRFAVAGELNRRGVGPGPFWGRPSSVTVAGVTTTKPAALVLPEFRACEQRLRAAGRRPSSCWQLLGAGAVGSQTITVLPVLERLRATLGVEVWPFTTGLSVPVVGPGTAVVAEIWPTVFDVDAGSHRVRDAAQVDAVARRLRDADRAGGLGSWFEPDPAPHDPASVVAEEGWVLAPPAG